MARQSLFKTIATEERPNSTVNTNREGEDRRNLVRYQELGVRRTALALDKRWRKKSMIGNQRVVGRDSS